MKNPFETPTLDQMQIDLTKLVTIAADDQQRQIDALEHWLQNRTVLVSIEQDGKKVRFLFVRNGKTHLVEMYNALNVNIDQLRRDLLE